ncbi:hypothetical protein ABK040_013741 [Willaertia magna]
MKQQLRKHKASKNNILQSEKITTTTNSIIIEEEEEEKENEEITNNKKLPLLNFNQFHYQPNKLSLQNIIKLCNEKNGSIYEWLKFIKMEKYYSNFIESNNFQINNIINLKENNLNLFINNLQDSKYIYLEIIKLKNTLQEKNKRKLNEPLQQNTLNDQKIEKKRKTSKEIANELRNELFTKEEKKEENKKIIDPNELRNKEKEDQFLIEQFKLNVTQLYNELKLKVNFPEKIPKMSDLILENKLLNNGSDNEEENGSTSDTSGDISDSDNDCKQFQLQNQSVLELKLKCTKYGIKTSLSKKQMIKELSKILK